jgi:hypothetical protein
MSEERGRLVGKNDEQIDETAENDVEAHRLAGAQDEQPADGEESPDVEAHRSRPEVRELGATAPGGPGSLSATRASSWSEQSLELDQEAHTGLTPEQQVKGAVIGVVAMRPLGSTRG